MKTETRDMISELCMLEVLMFFFYQEMKLAARAAAQNQTETDSNRLAAEELHDGLTILKFLRPEHTEEEIGGILRQQAHGQFLTRADNPPAKKLIGTFAQQTRVAGDTQVADWLDDVAREERRHEALVERMGKRITLEPVAHKDFRQDLLAEMLPLGTRYFMTLDPDDYTIAFGAFQRLADSAGVASAPQDRILRNVGMAAYTYQPW